MTHLSEHSTTSLCEVVLHPIK